MGKSSAVGEEGLEPSPLARHGPKPCACTNSATRPSILKEYYVLLYFAYAPIAQLVEQLALNEKVPGPNPGGRTIKCREWESNPQEPIKAHNVLSVARLPISPPRHSFIIQLLLHEAREGFAPSHNGFADRRVASSPPGRSLMILIFRRFG